MEAMELNHFVRAEADGKEAAAQRAEEEEEANGGLDILATETPVLRSSLAKLSVDKAFCIINQMRQNLQGRVDLAKREREAAEKEKMRKEENARKVLSMEEALMAKVVQNSRELEKEAEINTKVREFLIDRGHIVDALQGGVAVLSEDVKLLKEQMNGDITKCANRYLNINLAAPPRYQGMYGHWPSSNDDNPGPFSSRAHGSNVEISMSKAMHAK